eukprot:12174962-Alexandrium_andersonii.AAC.1
MVQHVPKAMFSLRKAAFGSFRHCCAAVDAVSRFLADLGAFGRSPQSPKTAYKCPTVAKGA